MEVRTKPPRELIIHIFMTISQATAFVQRVCAKERHDRKSSAVGQKGGKDRGGQASENHTAFLACQTQAGNLLGHAL